MKTRFLLIITTMSLFLSLSAMAAVPILADTEWLEAHIEDDNIRILEVRHDPHRYYTVGHIQGAIQVQRFRDLTSHTETPILRYPSRSQFQKTLRDWGVNNGSLIIIYGDTRTVMSARLYFLLDLHGFDMARVRILNGSTLEWTAFNDLEKAPNHSKEGNVTLTSTRNILTEWMEVYDEKIGRLDSKTTLVDTRPHAMYTGKKVAHSPVAGHIPGAINVVSLDATNAMEQTWFNDQDLSEFYSAIPKNHPVILYDIGGFRAPLAYVHLKHLGYKQVKIYNGGWNHWGGTDTLPAVTGEEPYGEDYSL